MSTANASAGEVVARRRVCPRGHGEIGPHGDAGVQGSKSRDEGPAPKATALVSAPTNRSQESGGHPRKTVTCVGVRRAVRQVS